MEDVHYYFDRTVLLFESIFAISCALPGVFLAVFFNFREGYQLLGQIVSLLVFGIFAGWRYSTIRFERATKSPAIALSCEGIVDNTRSISRGFVPWSAISRIEHVRPGGLNLILKHQDVPVPPRFVDVLLRNDPYQPGILILLDYLEGDRAEIELAVHAFWWAARDAQPTGYGGLDPSVLSHNPVYARFASADPDWIRPDRVAE